MLAVVFNCVLDDLGHLDEPAFVFGSGVKRNNCFPLSTMHDPVRQETRGEGETIRSVSGKVLLLVQTKLCEVDVAGPAWGTMLLLGNNLSFPFAADFGKASVGFLDAISVLAGEASSACLSLEDHCCVRRRKNSDEEGYDIIKGHMVHVYLLQEISETFDESAHLQRRVGIR
jgi:hypothetical protein